MRKEHEQDEYIDFALLPVLLHETLFETFVAIEAAERAYMSAAEKQYYDKKGFYDSLYDCAENLKKVSAFMTSESANLTNLRIDSKFDGKRTFKLSPRSATTLLFE